MLILLTGVIPFLPWFYTLAFAQSIQPPAIPLTVRGPYLQTYLNHATPTANSNQWPKFWTTNRTFGWTGLLRVDNAFYCWLGEPEVFTLNNNATLPSVAIFNGYQITPTRSILSLTAGKMDINVTFLSPIEPNDLVLQSFPFSYIYFEASSNDGNSHSVQVYQDISGEWLSHSNDSVIQWSSTVNNTILYNKAQQSPLPFMVEENNQAEDAVVYQVANTGSGVTYQTGEDYLLRSAFFNNGNLSNLQNTTFRAIQDHWPVLALSNDLGKITSTSSPLVWGIGLIRSADIIYTTIAGNQTRRPYFFTKYTDVPTAMIDFMSDALNARQRSISLDNQIVSDANAISSQYADLVSLAARQAMAGMEITVGSDLNGKVNASDVLIFMKDIGNSQRTNAVEILYAAFPSILYINSSWAGYLLEPLLAYQPSSLYEQAFATGDLGNAFPLVLGNNASAPFGAIEDSSDIIIMVWAHAKFSGDGGMLSRYYSTLKEWTESLISEHPLTPNKFVSADGLNSSNMTNLAIKGILAIRTMVEISTVAGESADAKMYSDLAASLVAQWQTLASSSGHLTSTYGSNSSWGLMYNLYYDKLFGFGLVSDDIYTAQTTWYSNALSTAPAFGFSYDSNQATTAKSHWTLLTAGTMTDNKTRDSLVSMVHAAASNIKTFSVFPTTYGTSDASVLGGGASPAQGAMYALLALNLPKKTVSAVSPGMDGGSPGGGGSSGNGGSGGSSKNSEGDKHFNAGAIAGGVAGGIAALMLLALVILFCRRHQRTARNSRGGRGIRGNDVTEISNRPGPVVPYRVTRRIPRTGPKLTLGGSNPKSRTVTPKTATGLHAPAASEPAVSESNTLDIAAELRAEVDNLRREIEDMRMRTQYEPPPEYQSDLGLGGVIAL